MPQTALRGDAQVQSQVTWNDQLAPGVALQTSAQYLDDDKSALASQVRRLLGSNNWYDPIFTTPNGKQRAVAQLNTSLDSLEQKVVLNRSVNLTNVSVPSGQNYVILSQSGGQDPSVPAAIGVQSLGSVVAQSTLSGASFGANELTAVTGSDAVSPKNLALIHNANTSEVLETNLNDIYGLLQVESSATDGAAFNDTVGGARLKISFVYINKSTKTLVACPPADIGGQTINYSYLVRNSLLAMPETAFTGTGTFVDNIGSADITLSQATANQNGAGIPVNTPVLWRVATSQQFAIQSSNGGNTFFAIQPSGASTNASITTTTFAIATQSPVTSTAGLSVATGGQTVNVGVTAGQVDSAGLSLTSTGSNPLKLNAGGAIAFKDGYLSGSTWTGSSVNLANSSTEINTYKSLFGEVSILAGISAASAMAKHRYLDADVVGGIIPAGTNLTGAGGSANLSVQFPDLSKATNIQSQVKVMRNGQVLRYGTGNDWILGQTPANGDIILSAPVRGSVGGVHGDALAIETYGI